jgi:2-oxoisovalerate dehydrogenase E1 component alpha subunit
MVENNIYAISVRQEKQMAVPHVADKAAGLGLMGVSVDGLDILAVQAAVAEAAERARGGEGPTLLEARVERMTPHSSDDDDRTYRPRDEVEAMKAHDPLAAFRQTLISGKILTEKADADLDTEARRQVEEAIAFAEAAPYPDVSEASYPVFVEDIRRG